MKTPKFLDLKSFLTFQILHELNKHKLCGDDLALIIGKRKFGKLTPGTIYPALKKLRKNNLIKYKQRGRKKIYSLTKKGQEEYLIIKRVIKKMFKFL
ncbi:PadR family transcriptional regulator [Candidatus Woesearchaeota archaeon]|nr:PadR family transcriptional regulator [Candidatus Woesearchaeota archaeon]